MARDSTNKVMGQPVHRGQEVAVVKGDMPGTTATIPAGTESGGR